MIGPFRGEYRFLSNFWPEPKRRMLTNEHFYQAAKSLIPSERAMIMLAEKPFQAKQLGSIATMRPDWDQVKRAVMLDGLRNKFWMDANLANLLLETGDEELVEINHWGDRYWGVDGTGHNYLGILLMEVREEIRHLLHPDDPRHPSHG